MSKRDYYDVLGINKGANEAEIKKSYRTLAKKYHPDVSSEANAEAKFKEVQEAYEVLSDSSKRSQYDRFGHQANNGQGFNASGFDFDINDIFSSFFGGGGSSRTSTRARKGQDIQKRMNISFEESIFGAKKHIRVNVHTECHTCHGTGAFSKKDVKTCSRCNGKGTVVVQQQSLFGTTRTQTTCPVCNGKDLTTFKDEFTHELDGSFNSNLLRSADKVHELVSGSKEFNESMEAIKSDDLPAYYESKEFTKGRVKPPR